MEMLNQADRLRLAHDRSGAYLKANSALELSQELSDIEGTARSYEKLCQLGMVFGDYREALVYGEKGLGFASGHREIEAAILNKIGFVYYRQSQYGRALKVLNRSLQLTARTKNSPGNAEARLNLGLVHWKTGEPEEALRLMLVALKEFEKINDRQETARSLISLGNIHFELKRLAEAESYFLRSLEIARATGYLRVEGALYGNLGFLYHSRGDREKALEFYNRALEHWKKIGERVFLGNTLYYLGRISLEKGDYKKALEDLRESSRIKTELKEEWDIVRNMLTEAEIYRLQKRQHAAGSLLSYALQRARAIGARTLERDITGEWARLDEERGDYRNALERYKKFQLLKNEVESDESRRRVSELQEKYRAESRDNEIRFLKRQAELSELTISREKKMRLLMTLGLISTIIFVAVLLISNYYRRRANRRLQKALNEIKTLSGLLPICAWCKKVRNDDGYWEKVEEYLGKHTDVAFSHGICPECRVKLKEEGESQQSDSRSP